MEEREDMGVINGQQLKTMKMNSVLKKAKTSATYSKKWHGNHIEK